MTALLFGSISSLADTSEIQRDAFNRAFAQHGLDWSWDQQEYAELLTGNGGRDRIADYASSRGDDVDADAVHATKSELFQAALAEANLTPRPGAAETIAAAKEAGMRVALVTTTSKENLAALAQALSGQLSFDDFDLVVDRSMVTQPKPDPEAYALALDKLGESAGDCVAVEDNVGGVTSAQAAGIRVVALPNTNTADHDFAHADAVREALDLDDLRGIAA